MPAFTFVDQPDRISAKFREQSILGVDTEFMRERNLAEVLNQDGHRHKPKQPQCGAQVQHQPRVRDIFRALAEQAYGEQGSNQGQHGWALRLRSVNDRMLTSVHARIYVRRSARSNFS